MINTLIKQSPVTDDCIVTENIPHTGTAKLSSGKTFAIFTIFHSIANPFPKIMVLPIKNKSTSIPTSNISFPANNHFPI